MKPISSYEFGDEVLRSKLPVIVYLWSRRGGPDCQQLGRQLSALDMGVKMVSFNVDDNPINIFSVPCLILYHKGRFFQRVKKPITKIKVIELLELAKELEKDCND